MGNFEYWVSLKYNAGNGMERVESGSLVVEKEIKKKRHTVIRGTR